MSHYSQVSDSFFPYNHKGSETLLRKKRKEQHQLIHYSIICQSLGTYLFDKPNVKLVLEPTNNPAKLLPLKKSFINEGQESSRLYKEYDYTQRDIILLFQMYHSTTPKSVSESISNLTKTNDTEIFFAQQRNFNWFTKRMREFNKSVQDFNNLSLFFSFESES